jgi:hypothetical protein
VSPGLDAFDQHGSPKAIVPANKAAADEWGEFHSTVNVMGYGANYGSQERLTFLMSIQCKSLLVRTCLGSYSPWTVADPEPVSRTSLSLLAVSE